jgi:hypothetical protein
VIAVHKDIKAAGEVAKSVGAKVTVKTRLGKIKVKPLKVGKARSLGK